jgi:hypothetical protein
MGAVISFGGFAAAVRYENTGLRETFTCAVCLISLKSDLLSLAELILCFYTAHVAQSLE